MKKLNFPVFKEGLPGPPILSMDQYYQFVEMHLRYFFNSQANEYWKKKRAVNVPFFLK